MAYRYGKWTQTVFQGYDFVLTAKDSHQAKALMHKAIAWHPQGQGKGHKF